MSERDWSTAPIDDVFVRAEEIVRQLADELVATGKPLIPFWYWLIGARNPNTGAPKHHEPEVNPELRRHLEEARWQRFDHQERCELERARRRAADLSLPAWHIWRTRLDSAFRNPVHLLDDSGRTLCGREQGPGYWADEDWRAEELCRVCGRSTLTRFAPNHMPTD